MHKVGCDNLAMNLIAPGGQASAHLRFHDHGLVQIGAAGAAIGGLTTAILVVNNLRDLETDAAVGKRTLAVRLGVRGTQAEYVLMLAVAYVVPAVGIVWLGWPAAVSWAYLTLPLCVPPVRTVLRYQDPAQLFPVLGQTSRVVAAYGLLLTLGLTLA